MDAEVAYGNTQLTFSVRRSDRKTLAIEVHPDLSIKVIAPASATLKDIEDKVQKRGTWITKQQAYFEQFLPRTPERKCKSGETHLYLGKRYLLKVRKSTRDSVKLKAGNLWVKTEDPMNSESVKHLLTQWYFDHALKKFNQRIDEALIRFSGLGLQKPPLVIRRMSKRWGSCTVKGNIILNPEIIKTPIRCIDYVIIHELCHLVHPHHGREFYNLQTQIMPDWERWKMKLEQTMI